MPKQMEFERNSNCIIMIRIGMEPIVKAPQRDLTELGKEYSA